MSLLARQRCLVHLDREAVARCISCLQYFCRECVGEHEGKMICAGCLRKQEAKKKTVAPRRALISSTLLFVASFFFLWWCFYGMGNLLLRIPSSFHDGSVWELQGLDEGWEGKE